MSHFDLRANLIERRNVEVNEDMARHYLKFNTYHAQREVRPKHVEDLVEKMKDGRFRFGDIAFGKYENQDIMINGQHQCEAIVKSGVTVPCVVEKYRCGSKLDLADLFCQFEYLARSQNDFSKARAEALSLTWPIHVVRVVISAAAIEHTLIYSNKPEKRKDFAPEGPWGVRPSRAALTKEEKVALLEAYLKEGEFINQIMTGSEVKKISRHLERAPVVYVMFLTWRKSQKDALTFWTNVRDGEILTRDMPEMRLREFLMSVNSHATAYSFRVVKPHEYICRCILAWNAFREGKKTNLGYSPNKNIPAVK